MRSAFVGVTLLAACGGGSGVDIEIKVEDGVQFDAVELYIAYDHCKVGDTDRDCPGVGWPGATTVVDGKVYELSDKLRVRSDVLKDGNGVLHLEAAPGFADPVAIGVAALSGTAGQESVVGAWVIHDMHIPSGNEQTWSFRLKKTVGASSDLNKPPDDMQYRATVWARETEPMPPEPNATLTDYAGCAAFQAWDGNAWTTEYFVPSDDTDCDGAPPDCDPLWNHAPSGVASKCVTYATAFPAQQPCTLAVATCADESTRSCDPLMPLACIPDAFCSCTGDPKSCIRDKVNMQAPAGIPSVRCPFVIEGTSSTRYGCGSATAGEKLTIILPFGCVAPDGNTPVGALRPYDNIFATGVQSLLVETAKIGIHVTSGTTSCYVDLTWAPMTSAPMVDQPVFAAIWSQGHQILIPVWLSFSTTNGTCTQLTTVCDPPTGPWPEVGIGADSMFVCTRGG